MSPCQPKNLHPAALSESTLLRSCEITRTRRSGPGGQHRNKVETAIVIRHKPTGIQAEASERRSQAENKKAAVFRLRLKLAVEYRTCPNSPKEAGTETSSTSASEQGEASVKDYLPSPLWTSRCKKGMISVATTHTDFPEILAEALDSIWTFNFEIAKAAQTLGVTTSQLVRLLKQHAPAFTKVNVMREKLEMKRLR